ncbi:MAG: type IX secretion system protein PorQ [Prevotellaceae bacterium]|nr:type IX secretion system protein PorQ [Prevotellaceae bacterium]MDY6200550.1 type IX secretion system protein PorQ [Prevotella sp.]
MKKSIFIVILFLVAMLTKAQESQTAYNFLRLPVSAHVAALGGNNITITDDDPTMIFHNPAMLGGVSDKSLNLNYMTYMEGTMVGSASFVRAWGDRGTWGVSASYMDYGSMRQTTADNIQTGEFSAKDIMLGGSVAYSLSTLFTGGITAKIISSSIAGYNSMAVAVDLGINYFDEAQGLSLSAVARNLGGQIDAYDEDFEKIPFDLQVGISKKMAMAPLRFSATLNNLHDWDDSFIHHLAIGADIFLSDNIYIAGGYNFRRNKEMRISDGEGESSHGAGLSFGGGVQLERFKLNVAYAKYHVSVSSLLINVSYSL